MSPEELRSHLLLHNTLTIDQAEALRQEGWLKAQERDTKSNAWNAPEHSSLSDRTRDNLGNHAALHLTTELFELQGQIKARAAEIENIRIQLAYDPVVPSE
jgi:hypothetical protein